MKRLIAFLALFPAFVLAQGTETRDLRGELVNPANDYALDFFTGSIEQKGQDLILRRCDTGDYEYILRPSPRAKVNYVARLKKLKLPIRNITTLTAHYVEIDGTNVLEIFKIGEIKRGKTCHLSDILQ